MCNIYNDTVLPIWQHIFKDMPIALRIKKVNLNVIPYSYAALFTNQTVDNLLKGTIGRILNWCF